MPIIHIGCIEQHFNKMDMFVVIQDIALQTYIGIYIVLLVIHH